jgi:hypothetical protein
MARQCSLGTEGGLRFGEMERGMKVTGETEWPMAMGHSITRMVTYIRETSKTTRPMGSEFMCTRMARSTKGSGRMICRTDLAKRNLTMAVTTMECLKMARNKDSALIGGQMAQSTKAIGSTTTSKGRESIGGLMEEFTKGSGRRISCMGRVSMFGRTEGSTWASTTWTKNMDMEFTRGQMGRSTTDSGGRESNTEKPGSQIRRERARWGFGNKARGSSGWRRAATLTTQ